MHILFLTQRPFYADRPAFENYVVLVNALYTVE